MNLLSYSLETGSLKIKGLASLVSSKSLAAGGGLSESSLAFLYLCITGVSLSSYKDNRAPSLCHTPSKGHVRDTVKIQPCAGQ